MTTGKNVLTMTIYNVATCYNVSHFEEGDNVFRRTEMADAYVDSVFIAARYMEECLVGVWQTELENCGTNDFCQDDDSRPLTVTSASMCTLEVSDERNETGVVHDSHIGDAFWTCHGAVPRNSNRGLRPWIGLAVAGLPSSRRYLIDAADILVKLSSLWFKCRNICPRDIAAGDRKTVSAWRRSQKKSNQQQ